LDRAVKVNGDTLEPSACLKKELIGWPIPVASTAILRQCQTFFIVWSQYTVFPV